MSCKQCDNPMLKGVHTCVKQAPTKRRYALLGEATMPPRYDRATGWDGAEIMERDDKHGQYVEWDDIKYLWGE